MVAPATTASNIACTPGDGVWCTINKVAMPAIQPVSARDGAVMHERGGREDMLAAAEPLRHVRSWHVTRDLTARRLRRAAAPRRRPKS
ncbi:hypothetical protein GCM10027436_77100 [Actinophytocola sediminis]